MSSYRQLTTDVASCSNWDIESDETQEPTDDNIQVENIETSGKKKISSISAIFQKSLLSVRMLPKHLGCGGGFAVIFGTIVGSGIFISPSLVTSEIKDTGLALSVWLISGIMCLLGSLCYCELGTVIRKTGGNYVYLLNIYGDLPGFLLIWTLSILIDPSMIAVATLTIGEYVMQALEMNNLVESNPWYSKFIASACMLITAAVNCASSKAVTKLQAVFTMFQLIAMLFIVTLGCWQLAIGKTENFRNLFGNVELSWKLVGPLGSAYYKCLWAYQGWHMLSNVAEEMVNVEKNMFLAVITAVPVVVFAYLAMNISYLTVLSPYEMSKGAAAASVFVEKLLGKKVAVVVPVLVATACFGSVHASMFSCPRGYLAAGREGHLPEVLGMIHKDFHTPTPSIMFITFVSHILLLPKSSDLNMLINLSTTAMWVIFFFIFVGVIYLRIREPFLHRSFKVWIIVPIIMSIFAVMLIVVAFVERPASSSVVIALICFGIPVYYGMIRNADRHPNCYKKSIRCMTNTLKEKFNLVPFVN